jgi:hypothetical protein
MSELIVPSSTLEKPKGGSSGGSLCGGPSCCLYSIRERGGGLVLVELLYEVFDVTSGFVI